MLRQLDDKVMVSGQIRPEDVPALKAEGVATIVNNRPDGEEPGQPLGAEIEKAARAAGIGYRSIPIVRGIGPADVESMQAALAECPGKLLVFCRSGTRSTYAWAVARARQGVPAEDLAERAAGAGVDIAPVAHLL